MLFLHSLVHVSHANEDDSSWGKEKEGTEKKEIHWRLWAMEISVVCGIISYHCYCYYYFDGHVICVSSCNCHSVSGVGPLASHQLGIAFGQQGIPSMFIYILNGGTPLMQTVAKWICSLQQISMLQLTYDDEYYFHYIYLYISVSVQYYHAMPYKHILHRKAFRMKINEYGSIEQKHDRMLDIYIYI